MHDLQHMYDHLNTKYFNGRIRARIRWTNFKQKSRWGFYKENQRLISINQVLDQDWIPREVVESVVYHEMCHQAYPPRRNPRTGRREIHHAEFKQAEARYPNIKTWKKWRNRIHRDKIDAQVGIGSDQLAENFRRFATQYGLDPSDLGKSFRIRRTIFTIIGLDINRPKFPIKIQTQRGKVYIERPETIRRYLGTAPVRTAPIQTKKEFEEIDEPEIDTEVEIAIEQTFTLYLDSAYKKPLKKDGQLIIFNTRELAEKAQERIKSAANLRVYVGPIKRRGRPPKIKTLHTKTKTPTNVACVDCGQPCIQKHNRWGSLFWACPAWPACSGRCPQQAGELGIAKAKSYVPRRRWRRRYYQETPPSG